MRHHSGNLLAAAALLLLAGCGSESGERTAEPTTPSSSETPASTGAVEPGPIEFTQVALISGADAGGVVSERATPLPDAEAARELTAGLTDESMVLQVERAVTGTDVPEGQALAGAVVAIGCEPPTRVRVELAEQGLLISAAAAKPSKVQCLVPITTVAVVSVPEGAVGRDSVGPGSVG